MTYTLYYDLKNVLTQAQIDAIDGVTDIIKTNGAYKFEPVPFVSMNEHWEKQPNEEKIRKVVDITLTGTFVNVGGVGDQDINESSDEQNLEHVYAKRKLLANCFAYDRGNLVLENSDGEVVFSYYPVITAINISDGNWVNKMQYTISMTAEVETSARRISQGSDTIAVTFNSADDTINVSRNISATGIVYRYGSAPTEKLEAVENAMVWVLSKLNGANIESVTNRATYETFLDDFRSTVLSSSALWNTSNIPDTNFPDAGYVNTIANSFSESRDDNNGTYSISIDYIKSKKLAVVQTSFDTSRAGTDQINNVVITGSVTGLGIDQDAKFANAVIVFNQIIGNSTLSGGDIEIPTNNLRTPMDFSKYNEANTITTWTLPATLTLSRLTSWSRGIDPKTGVINFTFAYSDAAKIYNNKYIVDVFTFNETPPSRVVVSIGIPFREAGSVVQDIGTVTGKEINVNISGTVMKTDLDGNTVDFAPTDAMFNNIIVSTFNSDLFSASYKAQLVADLITNASGTTDLDEALKTTAITSYTRSFDPIKRTFSVSKNWIYVT